MGGPGSHRVAQTGEVSPPRFVKESEAKGYCNRLKSDLLRYSDKVRGLTDAQKIEAHTCFERLASYPNASLSQAVDLLVARLDRATNSFPVRELAGRVVADKKKQEKAVAAANIFCARSKSAWAGFLASSVIGWSATSKPPKCARG